ncbi:MAG: 50S ribosomal protein L9 [Candidatus Scalindua sp.]|jgi:large subunit ribosomal protein L9|nr:50S ribosomal protein L9 [Candidatus Scalindua sp.]MBT5304581.1 50S ribosomal protein L9 [Candidatus Scalindua sp.]MBT6049776.1 50S ribosomal protein L9 [Candidatus Scalindua sp.]MBT6226246.1 50S ribosomal protein L9 [Candidatus Scalindua sp.]MBT6561290.1 50S ribosomal protein L9 [Candidatus Scalindua sp.]
MKILLKKEIKSLGNIGDVVDVANGYARNYLLPKKLATVVTKGNIEQINLQILKNDEKRKEEIKTLQVLADEISNLSYTITVKTNKEGKLFGSVTANDIAKTLSDKGFKIDEKMVILETPIKKCDLYNVSVMLHPDVKAQCRVQIVSESETPVSPQQETSEAPSVNNSETGKD